MQKNMIKKLKHTDKKKTSTHIHTQNRIRNREQQTYRITENKKNGTSKFLPINGQVNYKQIFQSKDIERLNGKNN